MEGASEPALGVVVPAHQAVEVLPVGLDGLFAAGFLPDEIFVVDDGSRDGTGDVARRMGVRVVRNETPLRPARARNRGVAETEADHAVHYVAALLGYLKVQVLERLAARIQVLEARK